MKRWYIFNVILTVLAFVCCDLRAQTVTLSVTNNAANNCNARIITASVSGGSGNFQYRWSAEPRSNVDLANSPILPVTPSQTTTYTCTVLDFGLGRFYEGTITVAGLLDGPFNVRLPNAFSSRWEVQDANGGRGPINAYAYDLQIFNRTGTRVFRDSRTITAASSGLRGGDISWNGTGTSGITVFNVSLRLFNCSNPSGQLFTFQITQFGSSSKVEEVTRVEEIRKNKNAKKENESKPTSSVVDDIVSPSEVSIFPNPAKTALNIRGPVRDEQPVMMFDQSGKMVLSQPATGIQTMLDISPFPNGIYLMQVPSEQGILRERIVVQR